MRHKKPVLLIDQDDVLAEYIKGVTLAFNAKYHTSFKSNTCNNWDLTMVFGDEIKTVMHEPELFENLEPVKDALSIFERLYRSELFDMYIVTAAQPTCVEAKSRWIQKHLPFFPLQKFIVCWCKYMIKGDYLLDDGMHNIEDFAKNGGIPVVYSRPHNINQCKEYHRVDSWRSFEQFILHQCYPERLEEYFKNSI